MIVKILQKSATFKAVRYNTGKIERDKGELLQVENFGILQGIENLRPQDYINYLQAMSSRNTRIKYPQFHVAISTKGRAHSKEELAKIGQQWMQGMGYGNQPYLVIYHKDTANNHIHIVSSRVGRDGKKIADAYEKIRAYRILNQILGENECNRLTQDLKQALSYSFSTRAQFQLLLELKGYGVSIEESVFTISKYGHVLDNLEGSKVDAVIADRNSNKLRIAQIHAFIQRYANQYNNELKLVDNKYSSKLSSFLYEKFGLQFIFHGKNGKTPYGYTIIDHTTKSVFKGGEIMSLREFMATSDVSIDRSIRHMANRDYEASDFEISATDKSSSSTEFIKQASVTTNFNAETEENGFGMNTQGLQIADDVDDEAVHGRRRRGKLNSR